MLRLSNLYDKNTFRDGNQSITTETLQLLLERGIFELDDIFNNMLGTLIGIGVVVFINGRQIRKEDNNGQSRKKI